MMTSAEILMAVQKRYIQELETFLYWDALAEKEPTKERCESREYYKARFGSLRALCDELFSPDDLQLMYEQAWNDIKCVII